MYLADECLELDDGAAGRKSLKAKAEVRLIKFLRIEGSVIAGIEAAHHEGCVRLGDI
jgi:hypothetical protein